MEETFELPLSPDLPSSPEHHDAPLDLIVNLTKEEWSEVYLYGLPLNHEQPWEFYTDSDRMPDQGVNLFMDVPPCLQDFRWITVEEGVYTINPTHVETIIPQRYFRSAENCQGLKLWERATSPTPGTSSGTGRFQFQSQLPPDKRAAPTGPRVGSQPREPIAAAKADYLLDENWTKAYADSHHWSEIWYCTQNEDSEWPAGYKVIKEKLYKELDLCIPEDYALEMVRSYHFLNGHPGVEKLVRGLKLRYKFPDGCSIREMATKVKRGCVVCQACEHPNWAIKGRYEMTPIPPAPFISVCVDIFSLPEVNWQENTYDALVLCVDRHSGWMIAQPSMHKGLTAEKCAHLLLDGGWTQFGVPSTITSDQGPQFVGQWFVTMCSRLGLRESFSQSHYPQANGRAEVAGQQLISLLRKLHAENEINWVEALPRALRHIHDRVGEGGLSPYQILLGRERPLTGLPYSPERESQEAQDYFDHIEAVDQLVAVHLNKRHQKTQERHDAKIRARPEFQVGDLVWIMKPKPIGGHKTQTYWVGPTTILSRAGQNSYTIATKEGDARDVHIAQLKPYFDDVLEGGVPQYFYQPDYRKPASETPLVQEILTHRTELDGQLWFQVRWCGSDARDDTWCNMKDLVDIKDKKWASYCITHDINSIPVSAMVASIDADTSSN